MVKSSADARKIFESIKITMANLYVRWQDEKGVEDFKDYAIVMEDAFYKNKAKNRGSTVNFIKASKRPFGFVFTSTDADELRTYQLAISGTQYSYKRIA